MFSNGHVRLGEAGTVGFGRLGRGGLRYGNFRHGSLVSLGCGSVC